MPIDTNKSHSTIVKELIDSYRATGKVGTTTPRNLEHAVRIANSIAYKAKEESVLLQMTEFNEENAKQLSIDVQKNISGYANSVIRENESQLSDMVGDFIHRYTIETNRKLRSFGVSPTYRLGVQYSTKNIITLDLGGYKIPIGYRQDLGNITTNLAKSVLEHNGHFYSRIEDSTLYIEITASYLENIKRTMRDMAA